MLDLMLADVLPPKESLWTSHPVYLFGVPAFAAALICAWVFLRRKRGPGDS